MKHLQTLAFFLVLTCASSFSNAQSSSVYIYPLTYDSLETHTGFEQLVATVTFQSNTLYHAAIFFRWSTNKAELEAGGGSLVYDAPRYVTPGTISRTEVYMLNYWDYQLVAPIGSGIYFSIQMDISEEVDSEPFETSQSPVYTWRFPTEVSTAVFAEDVPMISLYPNPAEDHFRIKGYSGSVQVTDALGREVLSFWIGQDETADVSALPSGTYIILADGAFLGRLQKL